MPRGWSWEGRRGWGHDQVSSCGVEKGGAAFWESLNQAQGAEATGGEIWSQNRKEPCVRGAQAGL